MPAAVPNVVPADWPIAPPFNLNAPDISQFAPEVTGRTLLSDMCARLGWSSLAGKRLLDFGCGVRFARTIVNRIWKRYLGRGILAQSNMPIIAAKGLADAMAVLRAPLESAKNQHIESALQDLDAVAIRFPFGHCF